MELLYEVPLPDVGYFLYRPQDYVDYEIFLIGSQKRAQEWEVKFEKYRKGEHVLYVTQEGDKEKVDILSEKSAYKCLGPKCMDYLKSL